jgi:hypothetical protein
MQKVVDRQFGMVYGGNFGYGDTEEMHVSEFELFFKSLEKQKKSEIEARKKRERQARARAANRKAQARRR